MKVTTSAPAKPPQREDRRRQRTRSAIITAGHKLFAARSMEGVSIDDIIGAADVAKGSFYNHFADKESLANTIIELVQGDCERHVFVVNQDIEDAPTRVARAMAVMVRYAHDHPDRLKAMLSLTARRTNVSVPLNAGVLHDLRTGLANGEFTGVTPEAGVIIVIGLISVAIDYLNATSRKITPVEAAEEIGAALLRALGHDAQSAEKIAHKAAKLALAEEEKQ